MTESAGASRISRLAGSASTYLRQHADNPVDWWPWGDEAFLEAARRDVPVLLSIGYASCHWCHVMAHESFEDPAVAQLINQQFVAIKVDREERPDVDAVYMAATQALTGQGGWPMTCFLTPDRMPFYAGTYFPPIPRMGMPSFRQLLTAIEQAWNGDRQQIMSAATRIAGALKGQAFGGAGSELGPAQLAAAAATLLEQLDPAHGGFRGAPKFPPAMVCEFLLRHFERTGDERALAFVTLTLDRMARGGIHDQLAGGFARYSVDSRWHVPHFEKMLDDNALLLRVYAHHGRRTGDARSDQVARQIAEFLLRDLRTAGGAFAASLDADTRGVEGSTYLWTTEELVDLLGPRDGERAAALFALDRDDQPDDLPGQVLRLAQDPLDPEWFAAVRSTLAQARADRPQPVRDDIVVVRSNGLAICALAEAGAAMDEPVWVEAAAAAASYLRDVHQVDGRWCRSSRDGRPGTGAAVLADHADLAAGLLALYQATADLQWLSAAVDLLDLARHHFSAGPGEYHDTAADADPMFLRPRDPTDGAAPSGASALAGALLTASALTGRDDYRTEAEAILAQVAELATRVPRSAGWHLAVAEALVAGPVQIAVVGSAGSDLDGPDVDGLDVAGLDVAGSDVAGSGRDELVRTARRWAAGGSVIEVGEPDSTGRELLAGRPLIDGHPAAYVCREFVCARPVTQVDELVRQLTH